MAPFAVKMRRVRRIAVRLAKSAAIRISALPAQTIKVWHDFLSKSSAQIFTNCCNLFDVYHVCMHVCNTVNCRGLCTLCFSYNNSNYRNSVFLVPVIAVINPQRACAARVTVLGLCGCVPVFLPPRTFLSQKKGINRFS